MIERLFVVIINIYGGAYEKVGIEVGRNAHNVSLSDVFF
jgi:hypothetical protein